jgi:hypothetical protein
MGGGGSVVMEGDIAYRLLKFDVCAIVMYPFMLVEGNILDHCFEIWE